jgi:hypothetical protein
LKVLHQKQIRYAVLNGKPAQLSDSLLGRISHQLDQRTRDVEL